MSSTKSKVFVIAEAGVNHNGVLELAFQLIDAAAAAGADAVKFQTFKADNLVTAYADMATYQKSNANTKESQLSMLRRLELSYENHYDLLRYCEDIGIQFLSTAFDMESLDFLVNDLGLRTLKVPSGEITNGPLLLAHARSGCDLIMSTGMATISEIEDALAVIAYGMTSDGLPEKEAFRMAYNSEEGRDALQKRITLLLKEPVCSMTSA